MVEHERMVQARAIDRRGPAVVLRRAQHADRIGRRSLILISVDSQSGRRPTTGNQPRQDKPTRTSEESDTFSAGLSRDSRHAMLNALSFSLARRCQSWHSSVRPPRPSLSRSAQSLFLPLQDHHDFVRRNCAFAQNLPSPCPRARDRRSSWAARGPSARRQ